MPPTTIAILVLSILLTLTILVAVILFQQLRVQKAQAALASKAGAVASIVPAPDYTAAVHASLEPVLADLRKIVQDAEAERSKVQVKVQQALAQPDPAKQAQALSDLYNMMRDIEKASPK